jgi:hypothetical protein
MNTPTVPSEPASVSTARVADNGGARRVAAQGRACSPAELAFLIGVPLLGCSAPLPPPPRRGGHGALSYLELQDKVTAWMVAHIGMMLFIPLFAAVVYLLLRPRGHRCPN